MSATPSAASPLVGIRIDIETRSGVPIKNGVYRYSEDPDFEVLLIAVSAMRRSPEGRMQVGAPYLLGDRGVSEKTFLRLLLDKRIEKHAFNANFERICLSRWAGLPTGDYLDPTNWHCSAVRANVNGVFGTLDEVTRALGTTVKKDPEGKRLIRLFSVADKKTGKFHDTGVSGNKCWCGADHTKDFERFADYCKRDVLAEADAAGRLLDVPKRVQKEYEADQRINDRGIRHHAKLSKRAVAGVEAERDRLMGELKLLTGLDNPNSIQQLRGWMSEQGYPMESLNKEARAEALADPDTPDDVVTALTLKGAASLSSVAKHEAALDTRSEDGRVRGSLQFYGAHTGREAGRGIQPQNLPRYAAPDSDRKRLLRGTAGADAPLIAKGTVRSSLVPAKGHVFVVADYNAIEARCLGWLSGERWVLNEFRGAGKIYEATASNMFGVDKDKLIAALAACGKCGACENCATRDQGKVSNLALGFAGGAGALVVMGAEDVGIDCGNYVDLNKQWKAAGSPGKFFQWNPEAHDYPELLRLRDIYRNSSPMTVRFWKLCAKAWDLSTGGTGARFGGEQQVVMIRDGQHNRVILPSGRSIWYRNARSIRDDDSDYVEARMFRGKGAGVGHTWVQTHGGKLCVSGEALVLTDRGWVKLRDVLTSDLVWDGVNYVEHEGLVHQGAKPVIDVEGVRMTPDHQIMQIGGWREAQQYDRSDWKDVGLPDSGGFRGVEAAQRRGRRLPAVESFVRLWNRNRNAAQRSFTRPAPSQDSPKVLRLHEGRVDSESHFPSGGRQKQAPPLRPVEDGTIPLHSANGARLEKLWGAGYQNVRALVERLLGVRRRHGCDVPAGAHTRPDRQRRELRAGELPVDLVLGTSEQPTEEVYDLLNAGPLRRFTVLTRRGPMLVHNCENITQAVARDVLFDLILKLERQTAKGYPAKTVLHVHDEVVLEVPERHAEQVLADTVGLMGTAPKWAKTLPLKGEGKIMERYGK